MTGSPTSSSRGSWPWARRAAATVPPTAYPEFFRVRENRMIGGVCTGLAAHLGVDLRWVRLAFAIMLISPGLAVPLYIGLWIFTDAKPVTSQALSSVAHRRAVEGAPGVQGLDSINRPRKSEDWVFLALGLLLLVLGTTITAGTAPVMVGLIVATLGVLLVWQTFGFRDSQGTHKNRWLHLASLVGGVVLLILGLGGTIAVLSFQDSQLSNTSIMGWALLASLLLIVGFVVVLVPLWLRLWTMANKSAMERAAEAERAEIASRIHDSVLQTLTMIQKNSQEPQTVTLARSQERQLRQWLFGTEESVAPETLLGAVRVACGEVEDHYGIRVRPVLIGADRPTDDASLALVLAGREAMVNAAKHSHCDEINVFLDAEDESGDIQLFVRDRGPGFSLDSIPADRQGVRQSIMGRMERAGGSVEIDSDSSGTEVILTLPAQRFTAQ
ncbi:ATP-binding protein [Corynebacterium suicordis]|uniref:PspC domain-containing protein n=1 Tax=Corynebacterium suicordis DSM 45110 TaxID=1121369 RepID=A0ABR9ZGG1_9CORY|nr:ATP-binding protein [Corynebacterium suicordis]MBF4552487.1 PspC domain-containing protein [Corynebacterium suicordis DSM 45110]MDR6278554.1 signal transduction histidine kinase [Corynebacterium suicordis]